MSADFSTGDDVDRLDYLRVSLRSGLDSLVAAWFPRCLDEEHGGFLCDFDAEWKPCGVHDKMLEYQARQTLTAAKIVSAETDNDVARDAAACGFEYLKNKMWDETHGGWFRMLNRSGELLEDGMKHVHGTSYAIAACAVCYELFDDPDCLDLAMQGFDWVQDHALDREHGGYFPACARDGTVLSEPEMTSLPGDRDSLGIPYGVKCQHTMVDLLDAFLCLHRVAPDKRVRKAMENLFRLLRGLLIHPPGGAHAYYTAALTPVPGPVRYAHSAQFASVLAAASEALDRGPDSGEAGMADARSLVEGVLRYAWDNDKGGIIYAGSAFGPAVGDDLALFSRGKIWWSQAEMLRSLAIMAASFPNDCQRYLGYFSKCWRYIQDYVIDDQCYGWRQEGTDTAATSSQPKASLWKDASHEARALLESLQSLNRL